MHNFFSLLKVQFSANFGFSKFLKSKKKMRGMFGMLAGGLLLIAVFGAFGYFYAETFVQTMLMGGSLTELMPLMITMASLFSFCFSFYATSAVLFGQKDYDLLASLPIKKVTVVASKLTFMLLGDLLFAVLIGAPSLYVYLSHCPGVPFGQIISIVLLILLSPFFPATLSVLVGTLINLVTSRLRHKNAVQTLLYILIFAGIFAISFVSGLNGEEDSMLVTGKLLTKIYFIYPLLNKGVQSVAYLALFAGVSIGSFAVVAVLVTILYAWVNTLLRSKRTRSNYKIKSLSEKGLNKTLINREMKKIFAYPTYAVNSLMGGIMNVLLGVVFIVVVRWAYADGDGMGILLASILITFYPALCAFTQMMAPTTYCSISIEGSAFWVIRTAPVSFNRLINVKLLVNALLLVLPSTVVTIASVIAFELPAVIAILVVVSSIAIGLLGGNIGLLANLFFPKMKWDNPNEAVKQSFASFICVIFAFVFAAIFGVLGYFVGIENFLICLIIISSISILLAGLSYFLIIEYGQKMLTKKVE